MIGNAGMPPSFRKNLAAGSLGPGYSIAGIPNIIQVPRTYIVTANNPDLVIKDNAGMTTSGGKSRRSRGASPL
jgi:hypothetical protein